MTDDVSTAEMPPDLKKYLLVIIFDNQIHEVLSMRAQIEFVPKEYNFQSDLAMVWWCQTTSHHMFHSWPTSMIRRASPNNNESYTWIKT